MAQDAICEAIGLSSDSGHTKSLNRNVGRFYPEMDTKIYWPREYVEQTPLSRAVFKILHWIDLQIWKLKGRPRTDACVFCHDSPICRICGWGAE